MGKIILIILPTIRHMMGSMLIAPGVRSIYQASNNCSQDMIERIARCVGIVATVVKYDKGFHMYQCHEGYCKNTENAILKVPEQVVRTHHIDRM